MSELTIRRAEPADLPQLRALQERSLRQLGRGHYGTAQIEAFIARVGTMDDYLVADRTYLLAETEGSLVGCGGWTTRLPGYARRAVHPAADAARPGFSTVRSIFVEPLAARGGVGRRIMAAVESSVTGLGFHTAELGATENARTFYERVGYRPLGVLEVDLGDGIAIRFTRMRKSLAPAAANDGAAPRPAVAS